MTSSPRWHGPAVQVFIWGLMVFGLVRAATAQTPSREYIRLGDRVIATENSGAGILVTASPSTVSLGAGQSQQFNATVTGSLNQSVTWSISPAVGTISATGLYTAPAVLTSNQVVTVTATSVADITRFGTATVTLRSDFLCWSGASIGTINPPTHPASRTTFSLSQDSVTWADLRTHSSSSTAPWQGTEPSWRGFSKGRTQTAGIGRKWE